MLYLTPIIEVKTLVKIGLPGSGAGTVGATPRAVRSEGRAGDSNDLVVLTATRDMMTGI